MMIWIWIFSAVLLTVICLRGKTISFENFIWILLPIDAYGISIGFTVKPYMVFSAILFFRMLLDRKREIYIGNGSIRLWIVAIPVIVIINMLNSNRMTGMMSSLMLLVVFACASIYLSSDNVELDQIPDILVATSIGYGLIFIAAYILTLVGIPVRGAFTANRTDPGIVMQFNNFLNNQLVSDVRLRGFSIDPNTVVGMFIAPIAVDIFKLSHTENKRRTYLISLIVSLLCILLTNSRTAFLVTGIAVLYSIYIALHNMESSRRSLIVAVSILVMAILIWALIASGLVDRMQSGFVEAFSHRASLNDENGRLSIWREAVRVWCEKGFLFGIGFDQMKHYSVLGWECHNTWLEWLCSCGIFIGGIVVIVYWSSLIAAIRSRRKFASASITYNAVLLGLIGIMASLFTVDNITNSYLCFYLLTLNKIRHEKIEREQIIWKQEERNGL